MNEIEQVTTAQDVPNDKAIKRQLADWKKKYGDGNVMAISVAVSDKDTATAYVVKPEAKDPQRQLAIYQRTISFIQQSKTVEAGQYLLNECWLGGDERIKGADAKVHIAAVLKMVELVSFLDVSMTVA